MEKMKRKYSRVGCLSWAIRRLWGLNRSFVFSIFLVVPMAVLLPLAESLFTRLMIDNIGAGMSLGRLAAFATICIAVITVMELLNKLGFLARQAWHYYPTCVYQSEMSEFSNYRTDYENTEKQEFKRISQYAWEDACHGNCAMEFFGNDLSQALIHLSGIVTYASLLAVLDPVLFAVTAVVSVSAYFTTRWQPAYYESHKHLWEKESRKKDYFRKISEDFSKAKDIKLYGLDRWLEKMMKDYQTYLLIWNRRCSLRGLWASVLSGLMTLVQNGAAYFVLIGALVRGGITVGEFVFYFGLVGGIAGFLQGIIGDVATLTTRADKIACFREYFDYPSCFCHGPGEALPKAPVEIELKNIRYRYGGAKEDTLKGINLKIKAGEKLALVGINGAGKTTLVKLLCGMYRPTEGEILVGGKDIGEYNIEEYYTLISAVFQEVRVIAFTCFEFVASSDLNRPTAREDAEAAMKAAEIYEKIRTLPKGMDTHLMKGIYEDGVDLSGGEMQKLLLARAIYKNGAIFILDEPTAALDPIAENNLYLQYRALTAGRTSVYISHRFASTRFCDRIVLLEDGVILESGTHEELMEQNGRYAEMFDVQSRYYKEGGQTNEE